MIRNIEFINLICGVQGISNGIVSSNVEQLQTQVKPGLVLHCGTCTSFGHSTQSGAERAKIIQIICEQHQCFWSSPEGSIGMDAI